MRLHPKIGLRTFAVVIDKEEAIDKYATSRPTSDIAWEYLLQRLDGASATRKFIQTLV